MDKENEYVLYVLKDMKDYAKENLPTRFKIKTIPYGSSYLDVVRRSLFEQRFWYREERIERFDVFHSPFFHSPKFKHAKVVMTVHDMRFYRFPYTYTKPRYLYLVCAVKKSVKYADHIITISEFTKNELMDAYKTAANKITVIYEAINRSRFNIGISEGYELPASVKTLEQSRFLLSVGHIEPRKNYNHLVESFKMIKQREGYDDLKLVIVGKKGHHYKDTIKLFTHTKDVYYLDFVEHVLLVWLYQHASLFVFPSFYEGFGFPPLEAGCFGVPSAVSNISSMPEICGDAVAYFDPCNLENMTNVITSCLENLQLYETLREKINQRIDWFSWNKNAKETLQVYRGCIDKSHVGGGNYEVTQWLLAA